MHGTSHDIVSTVPATNHAIVLRVFDEDFWPSRIDDPLPASDDLEPKRCLRNTIGAFSRPQSRSLTWFKKLTGADEESPDQVRRELKIDDDCIVCPNGNRIAFGHLETPKLSELRETVSGLNRQAGTLAIREVIADVRQLHADATNANALFQVASQFNLLEMTGPTVTPERGVGIYQYDHTQGPSCAIACGAGTIYRNYFAPVGDAIGQSTSRQIDCSSDLGQRLGNLNGNLWMMENGYLFPSDGGLDKIATRLQSSTKDELDQLRGELRIGLQWNAEVTLPEVSLAGAAHRVSQAYCSALPVAYGRQPKDEWAEFAKLVLDAAYEATLCAGIINAERTGNRIVYLTLLGGGVFGNRDAWIIDAIERSLTRYRDFDIDVTIVSYRRPNHKVAELVSRFR
ncbi:MAG: hypothetical protein KDB00_03070 [Planctomycetales bacterium]|nr:hypothetical protein [Planctomycetales bacterium]